MAKKSAAPSLTQAMRALRKRLAERPDTASMWNTIRAFDTNAVNAQHTDRALALVLGAILEQALETAIMTHCTSLDGAEKRRLWAGSDDAPIPFSIKLRFGFALGIFGPRSRADLNIIRHVRNLFAHTKTSLEFGSSEVRDLCDQLQWIDVITWGGILGSKPTTARRKYLETVRHFFAYFEDETNKPTRFSTYMHPWLYE
jgi:hypothetical protein